MDSEMAKPTNPEQNAARMAQLIRLGMEEMQTPAYCERLRFIAADKFAQYQSFISAGFTEAQSLALVIGKL